MEAVKRNVTIGWTVLHNVRAYVRVVVKNQAGGMVLHRNMRTNPESLLKAIGPLWSHTQQQSITAELICMLERCTCAF